jgi:hypothetical protein
MNLNQIVCPYCEKEYNIRKKTEYERHIILCELISTSNSNKHTDTEEDEENMPSQFQMYKMIRELSIQNKKLQEKVINLEKIIQRGVSLKKVDILERLNSQLQQKQPEDTYQEWINSFNITEEDVESLVSENIVHVISGIICRHLSITNMSLPIISCDLKKSMIYIYGIFEDSATTHTTPSSSPENGSASYILGNGNGQRWIKMEPEHFMILICSLYKKLLTVLQMKWRSTNMKRYNFDDIYMKILGKITGIKIDAPNDLNNRKIWQYLYTQVSRDI